MGISDMDGITVAWVLGTIIGVLTAILGAMWKMKHAEHSLMWKRMDEHSKAIAENAKQASDDLNSYRLYVAENYVSARTFEKFQDRVLKAIEDLREAVLHHEKSK